jgi:hypothetical protein
MGGLGGQEASVEAGASRHGGPGQALGEGVVVTEPGRPGPRHEQLGVATAADKVPRRQ